MRLSSCWVSTLSTSKREGIYTMSNVTIDYSVVKSKITADDISKIRNYVREGFALPQDSKGVEIKFKSQVSATDELSVNSLLITFKNIKEHAVTWSGIETDMRTCISTLSAFRDDLGTYAGPALEEIKKMPGYINYKGEINKMDQAALASFKSLVNISDRANCQSVAEIFEGIKKSIEAKSGSVTKLRSDLKGFEEVLKNKIQPDVGSKLKTASSTNTLKEISDIDREIAEFYPKIESAREKTESNASDFFWMFVNPEKVRSEEREGWHELNEISNKVSALLIRKRSLNALSGLLQALSAYLNSLHLVVKNAIDGLGQIDNAWKVTSNCIADSKATLESPGDWKLVAQLVIKVESVLDDWSKIKQMVEDVKKALN